MYPFTGKINKSGIEKVMLILPRTIDLFTMFLKETDCVKSLLEMMLSFSYQDAVTMKYRAVCIVDNFQIQRNIRTI